MNAFAVFREYIDTISEDQRCSEEVVAGQQVGLTAIEWVGVLRLSSGLPQENSGLCIICPQIICRQLRHSGIIEASNSSQSIDSRGVFFKCVESTATDSHLSAGRGADQLIVQSGDDLS